MWIVVEIDIFNSFFLKPQPKQTKNQKNPKTKTPPKKHRTRNGRSEVGERAPGARTQVTTNIVRSTSNMSFPQPAATSDTGSDARHERWARQSGARAQRAQRRSTLILQSPGLFFCMVPAGDGRIMTRTGWDLSRGGRFVLGWTFDALS